MSTSPVLSGWRARVAMTTESERVKARLANGLDLASYAVNAGRDAMAHGNAYRAALAAERAIKYLQEIDSPDFPEPSPEWQTRYDASEPTPDATDIDSEVWPDRY